MDCSPPGSCVHEIFQAGILEWVAISFSRIFIGGVTLRKEVGGGNPTTRRHEPMELVKALPAQRLQMLWVQWSYFHCRWSHLDLEVVG